MAIAAMGFGKLLSVWIGGELSDRVGRKKFAVAGAVAYIICFTMMLLATDATACYIAAFLSGVATSGFWDAALYPAAQEAEPKYAAFWRYRHQSRRFRYGRYLPHLRCSIQRTSYLAR